MNVFRSVWVAFVAAWLVASADAFPSEDAALMVKALNNIATSLAGIGQAPKSSLGQNETAPGISCHDILTKGHSRGDGLYWIKHPGYAKAYQTYCDMTTESGGWTLFATKVQYQSAFITDTFTPASAKTTTKTSVGCIPGSTKWKQVLFRFKSYTGGGARVVYNKKAGADVFSKTLTCGTGYPNKGVDIPVGGFYKHSPYDNGNRRVPSTGYKTMPKFYITKKGFSEFHGHTNRWLDLWSTRSGIGNKYPSSDNREASGSKCVAGVCRLNEPILLMYR